MRRKLPEETWFWQIGTELQRLTEKIRRGPVPSGVTWQPNVDVLETEESLELSIELAGVEAENVLLHYDAESNSLAVKGRREPGPSECAKRCHVLEVLYGEFERVIGLPNVAIKIDEITARYEKGMLYVRIPKREGGERRRRVRIT